MVFREVSVIEIREVLRSWLAGAGAADGGRAGGGGPKTARRYVEAMAAGLARDGGTGQLTDELVGQVAEAVRPARPGGHGQPWEALEARREEIRAQVKQGLTVVRSGCCWSGRASRCRTGRCTGSAPSAADTAVPPRPRCGSPTASRGPNASWTSATWACWPTR